MTTFIIIFVVIIAATFIVLNMVMNRIKKKKLSKWETGDTIRLTKSFYHGRYDNWTDITPYDIDYLITSNTQQNSIDVKLLKWHLKEMIVVLHNKKYTIKIPKEFKANIKNISVEERESMKKYEDYKKKK